MVDKVKLKAHAESALQAGAELSTGTVPVILITPEDALALLAEIERLEGCEEVLRKLASYVGAGGYNTPEVDPEVFVRKIMDGINILNDPLAQLAEKRGAERDQLKAENEALRKDAERYKVLRQADIDTIQNGGLFAGLVPDNIVINGCDQDRRTDAVIAAR
ncbi:conserved hypothetical protein [Pseudomonas veronii]|uniref:hypothetical protein n=1 Tax=Pseudomonas veronii TaxID=76761 RepID=UPI0017581283|nr:hypothetical protein [Pseudomonas veronii]CAD0264181.1 conserved hypothetical protein [Pseudomonas veronii]